MPFSGPPDMNSPASIDLLSPTAAGPSSSPRTYPRQSPSPLSGPASHQLIQPTNLEILGEMSHRPRNEDQDLEVDSNLELDSEERWPRGNWDARSLNQGPNSPNRFGVVNAPRMPGGISALEEMRSARGPTTHLVLEHGASTTSSALPLVVGEPATYLHSAVSQTFEEALSEHEEDVTKGELSRLIRETAQVTKLLQRYQEKHTTPVKIVDYINELDEVEELKKARQKDQEFRDAVRNTVQCHICYGLMSRPHALNPCGHVCCMSCLQEWFCSVREDDERPDEKLCPFCRAKIQTRPVELFIIKGLIAALALVDEPIEGAPQGQGGDATSSLTGGDPWEGIFDTAPHHTPVASVVSIPDLTDDGMDRVSSSVQIQCPECYHEGPWEGPNCANCGWLIYSGSEGGEDDEDEDQSDADSNNGHDGGIASAYALVHAQQSSTREASHHEDDDGDGSLPPSPSSDGGRARADEGWIYPSWAPCINSLSSESNGHLTEAELVLCSRGVPYAMISKFGMTYTGSRGLCAKVRGAPGSVNGGDEGEGEGQVAGTLWLGWNLSELDSDDIDGSMFIAHVLEDMLVHPRRYVMDTLIGGSGSNSPGRGMYDGWGAWRLVREVGPKDADHGHTRHSGSGNE